MTDGNIVLAGPPGSGTTTVGRRLAERLHRTFVDADAHLAELHGHRDELVAQPDGDERLRRLAHDAVRDLAARSHLVIATGERTLLDRRNVDLLAGTGTIVRLDAADDALLRRLAAPSGTLRPRLARASDRQAHVQQLRSAAPALAGAPTIDTTELGTDEVVDALVELLRERIEVTSLGARTGVEVADARLEPDADHPRRRRTHVVRGADGVPRGALVARWSHRHPDVVFVEPLLPDPDPVLLAALAAAIESADRPLLFNVAVDDPLGPLLDGLGATSPVESRTVRLELAELAAPTPPPDDATVDIEPVSDEVVELYERVYVAHHGWAGRSVADPHRPHFVVAGPPVDGTLAVGRVGGEAVVATCIHTGPFADGADGFVPPSGPIAEVGPDAVALVRSCLGTTLAAGQRAGLRAVMLEHDTPYTELGTVLDELPTEALGHRCVHLLGPS
ncbi:MAG: shikimate kinase [Actinomycetota bacterium]